MKLEVRWQKYQGQVEQLLEQVQSLALMFLGDRRNLLCSQQYNLPIRVASVLSFRGYE